MFHDESPRTWLSLSLLGLATALFVVCATTPNFAWRGVLQIVGGLMTATALMLIGSSGSLGRGFGEIYRDLQSGRQARTTLLQKICFVFGVILLAVQIRQSLT